MNGVASILLLVVAAGLLILLGAGVGREGGRQPPPRDTALMAGMTGVAIGFLVIFLFASPMVLAPTAIAGILVAAWSRRGQWQLVGAFLVGGGLLVAVMNAMWLVSDLRDPAVHLPGWTPIPLALSVAFVVLGFSLVLADRS